jgi:8-oxo-dGTP diphosphatase
VNILKDVVAGIIVNEDKILIAKRAKGEKLEGKWEFPGGKIENGETPEEALIREFKEELNVDINVNDYFCESIYKYEFGEIRLLAYMCNCTQKIFQLSVHSEMKWAEPLYILDNDFAPADIPIAEKLYKKYYICPQ